MYKNNNLEGEIREKEQKNTNKFIFFKPTILEIGLFMYEILYVSFPIAVVSDTLQNSGLETLAYALTPQAATYVCFRLFELTHQGIGKKNAYLQECFQNLKLQKS